MWLKDIKNARITFKHDATNRFNMKVKYLPTTYCPKNNKTYCQKIGQYYLCYAYCGIVDTQIV